MKRMPARPNRACLLSIKPLEADGTHRSALGICLNKGRLGAVFGGRCHSVFEVYESVGREVVIYVRPMHNEEGLYLRMIVSVKSQ
jgi:anthranilate/para-aminobenzoate synthase component II